MTSHLQEKQDRANIAQGSSRTEPRNSADVAALPLKRKHRPNEDSQEFENVQVLDDSKPDTDVLQRGLKQTITNAKRRRINKATEEDDISSVRQGEGLRSDVKPDDPAGESDLGFPESDDVYKPKELLLASDSDWLRSRTNRLLDLVSDDELDKDLEKGEAKNPITAERLSPESRDQEAPVSAPEAETIPPRESPQSLADTASKHDTRRLFVRNLSYETTESSLQSLFDKFGAIDEVSGSVFERLRWL